MDRSDLTVLNLMENSIGPNPRFSIFFMEQFFSIKIHQRLSIESFVRRIYRIFQSGSTVKPMICIHQPLNGYFGKQ